jgi:hypothetical protein
VKRGRHITWTLQAMPAPEWLMEQWPGSATIIAVRSQGIRDGRPTDESRYYVTSLRTGAKALLQHIRDRWSISEGIASPAHDIKGLLRLMGWREPAAATPSG